MADIALSLSTACSYIDLTVTDPINLLLFKHNSESVRRDIFYILPKLFLTAYGLVPARPWALPLTMYYNDPLSILELVLNFLGTRISYKFRKDIKCSTGFLHIHNSDNLV